MNDGDLRNQIMRFAHDLVLAEFESLAQAFEREGGDNRMTGRQVAETVRRCAVEVVKMEGDRT